MNATDSISLVCLPPNATSTIQTTNDGYLNGYWFQQVPVNVNGHWISGTQGNRLQVRW